MDNKFESLIDEVIEEELLVVDQFVKEVIEPIGAIGSPEKVIGKPYEQWTQQDLLKAYSIYKSGLEDFIKNKEYDKMLVLDKQEV